MEEWRAIEGYPFYEVSNEGRVRSLRFNRVLILKLRTLPTGYVYAPLAGKKATVHRLVAKAFIPNPNNYPTVNHIDGNKSNNCVENLEWCTQQYNNQHSLDTGLRKLKGIRCIETGIEYPCCSTAAKSLGVSKTFMLRICGFPNRSYNGLHFEYIDHPFEKNIKLKHRTLNHNPVICLETGIEYKNIAVAAKAFNTSIANLCHVINKPTMTLGGCHFIREENS